MNKPFDLDDTQKQESPLAEVGGVTFLDSSKYNIAEATAKAFASLDVCYFKGHGAKQGRAINLLHLIKMIEKPITGNVTEHTPENVKAVKTALPLVTPFVNRTTDGKTKEDALAAKYSCIVIDFDHEQVRTLEGTIGLLKENHDYTGAILGFTTSSHTLNGENAFKVILPLADACDVHQYEALSVGLMKLLDTDPAQARKQQGFYAPCDMLSPSVYLSLIDDGDSTLFSPQCELWQQAIRTYQDDIEQQQQAAIATSSKPRPKAATAGNSQNIFELINKSYDMAELLERAGHKRLGRKWLSPHSTSGFAGGLIFDTPQGQRFYSHSSSCPLGKDANNGHSLDVADVLAVTCYAGNYSAMIQEQAKQLDPDGQKQRQHDYMQAQEQQKNASVNANNHTDKTDKTTTDKPTVWSELSPLVQVTTTTATPYPIHALPPLLSEAAQAIAEYVQAPIAMTAQCVIGAISHIAQTKVNAPCPTHPHGEPCSLFLLTEGQSGSRKSTSKDLADKAITAYELIAYAAYTDELQQWKKHKAAAKAQSKDRLEEFLEYTPEPQSPKCRFTDITLEALAGVYIDGDIKNASISSDEAAQFFGGHTLKSDTRTQALGSFTKLFDKGFVERARAKSNLNGSGQASDVRLTFNLQGQREILAHALTDDTLREQGFLPRFILTVPENLAGTRLQNAAYRNKNANKDHRLIAYWTQCESLLDSCPQVQTEHDSHNGRYVIPMNEEAKSIDLAFYNECEAAQDKGRKYAHIQPFASRGSQIARRLATVFAFFQGEQEITAQNMQGACDIIRHSLGEWLRYADIESKKESDAEKLIKWVVGKCVQQKTDRLTYSYIQTSCPRPMQKNKNLLEMVIQQLEDSHHIKIESLGRTRYVVINPLLLKS